jgi:hypothetical protein
MRKLTQQEYYELQAQFEKTPAANDNIGATGEHYILMALLGRFGFRENSTAKAMLLAERLLSNGY